MNSIIGHTYYGEDGYLCLVNNVLKKGVSVPDRTGVGSVAIFDAKIVFNSFPLFTHRKISPRLAFEEMWFFLNGDTDTNLLEEKGVNFWKGNTSREFLDNRGLEFLPEKDMGAAYSLQWRNFGGWYDSDNGVDQLEKLINSIEKDPYGRRHLVTLWNPSEEHLMPLTPCWWACQFVVLPNNGVDTLHLKLINRSLDVLYGAPFALQQYRMLQMAIASMFDMEVGVLVADLSQVHIYNNQIEWAKELLKRDWWLDGDNSVTLNKKVNGVYGEDGLLSLKFSDFNVKYEDYNSKPFKTPKPPMAV